MLLSRENCRSLSAAVGGQHVKLDHVPVGFFAVPFCGFAGAGGGPGARSIDTRRPPAKR
jgi:hypothetical protein